MGKVKMSAQSKKLNKRKSMLDTKSRNVFRGKPKKVKGKRILKRKMEREPAGVVYLAHIPHGFYEEQIQAYFSQFGKVTAVSVPRGKSGRARGYAFIQYKHPEIAEIAADTMNNYLMFNRLLKAKYIPLEQQKPHLFNIAKAVRENHQTAAEKAALAVKHNRKLKNRYLKLSQELKCARKLLKKKNAMMKRAESLGLTDDIVIEEANIKSVFEKKKELKGFRNTNVKSEKDEETEDTSEDELSSAEDSEEANVKSLSEKKKELKACKNTNVKSEKEEETEDTSEDELSFTEDSDESESIQSVDSLSDIDDFDLSESEEEDYKKIITKAKNAAKDILKKYPKPANFKKPNKGNAALHVSPEFSGQSKTKKFLIKEDLSSEKENLQSPKNVAKGLKRKTPLKELPKAEAVEENQNKNAPPKRLKERKRLSKKLATSSTEKTPPLVKKNKASILTPANRKSNKSQLVMEVDENDEEINFKTPPNVVKKVIKTEEESPKKTPKQKSPNSSKKERIKSPGKIVYPSKKRTPEGKKLRHRNMKAYFNTDI